MLVHALRHFADFEDLDYSTLSSLAQHTQLLNLPAERWLVQPGGRLAGHFYLHRGRLETFTPDRELDHRQSDARQCVYPGVAAVRTLVASQVLHLDWEPVEFLKRIPTDYLQQEETESDWELKFLRSPMMQHLSPRAWQQVLRSLEELSLQAGEDVVRLGAVADACFIVGSGHAVVHRDGQTLSHLGPGDFFGEDALVFSGRRNATVTMLAPGKIMALSKDVFNELVLDATLRFVQQRGRGVLINVGEKPIPGAIPVTNREMREKLKLFDPQLPYFVCGGELRERALGAFLMLQQGLRASVVR